jgi:hypothetical protein
MQYMSAGKKMKSKYQLCRNVENLCWSCQFNLSEQAMLMDI